MAPARDVSSAAPTTSEAAATPTTAGRSSVSVNGSAAVVCAVVQTANATVHIIDHVLMPN